MSTVELLDRSREFWWMGEKSESCELSSGTLTSDPGFCASGGGGLLPQQPGDDEEALRLQVHQASGDAEGRRRPPPEGAGGSVEAIAQGKSFPHETSE